MTDANRPDVCHTRTPIFGVLSGYVAACLVVPLCFAIIGIGPEILSEKRLVDWPEFGFFGLTPIILVFCIAPFAGLRWALSKMKPYRLWKNALFGALPGTVMGVLIGEGSGIVALKFCLAGALAGAVSFLVERQSRTMRLNWMLAKEAAHPGWKVCLTQELTQARELQS
ncbi:hypothetical protein [Tropicibacter oceani]|uniref:Uncharacterized protein n=1 Tax=Tropicibacter oceani TaxID=3058420 RepID=A0ABY8QDQ9_9RHOB|nr:hypothetical protein [Tropicibacter oceani]WGW02342.1 hypothetical protein QF118_10295 [Tropicibacter oceani]